MRQINLCSNFPKPRRLNISVEVVVAPFAKPHWRPLLIVHVFVHQVGWVGVVIISLAKPHRGSLPKPHWCTLSKPKETLQIEEAFNSTLLSGSTR